MSFSARLLMMPDWQALLVVLAAIIGPFFGGRCHVWGATRGPRIKNRQNDDYHSGGWRAGSPLGYRDYPEGLS